MKSTFLKGLVFDIAVLITGGALWFYRFAMGFYADPWAWAMVGLQVAIALFIGWGSVRWLRDESSGHRGVRLFLFELGHIYMTVWAAMNFSYLGKIDMSASFFILPALADILAWWFGKKLAQRHTMTL